MNHPRSYPVLYFCMEVEMIRQAGYSLVKCKTSQTRPSMKVSHTDIIIMPDIIQAAEDGANNATGMRLHEDFCPKRIHTLRGKWNTGSKVPAEFRAIAGLSMGGDGSLIRCLLHHPELLLRLPVAWGAGTGPSTLALSPVDECASRWFISWRIARWSLRYNSTERDYPDSITYRTPRKKRYDGILIVAMMDFCMKAIRAYCYAETKGLPMNSVRNGNYSWVYWRTALPEVLVRISGFFIKIEQDNILLFY